MASPTLLPRLTQDAGTPTLREVCQNPGENPQEALYYTLCPPRSQNTRGYSLYLEDVRRSDLEIDGAVTSELNCTTCLNREEALKLGHWIEYPTSSVRLRKSARSGCAACKMLKKAFATALKKLGAARTHPWGPSKEHADEEPDIIPDVASLSSHTVEAGYWEALNLYSSETCTFPFELFFLSDAPLSWHRVAHKATSISGDTSSDQCFATLKSWIDECTKEHEVCQDNIAEVELPTRVLDVGVGANAPIVLSESGGKCAPYVCLSHRWGNTSLLTTTSSTLDARKRGIPWKDLPLTFQEAVIATRRLGLRYLWIDSLCIMQDNELDWAIESARMSSTYSNAYLTIAATSATDSSQGLFRRANADYTGFALDEGFSGVHLRKVLAHDIFGSHPRDRVAHHLDACRGDSPFNPLISRAWVFQEQWLSPRVAHFCENELVWECNTQRRCECDTASSLSVSSLKADWTKAMHVLMQSDLQELSQRLQALWKGIVELFVERDITYVTDRLPALSGIAQKIPSGLRGHYFAGIWEDDLLDELAWFDWNGYAISARSQRLSAYVAPTWSWACSNSKSLKFCSNILGAWPRRLDYVSVIDVNTTLKTTDPYGAVASGYILLHGALFPLALHELDLDTRHFYADYDLDLEGDYFVSPEQEVYLLLWTAIPSGNVYDKFEAMVLRRARTSSEEFERIGWERLDEFNAWNDRYKQAEKREIRIV